MSGFQNKSKTEAIQSLIEVYQKNREDKQRLYPGYAFTKKLRGQRYRRNVIQELRRYCFDEWKSGKSMQEIAYEVGLKTDSSVGYHIKQYCRNS